MKKIVFATVLSVFAAVLNAAPKFSGLWMNLDERHYVDGEKISEDDLESMVVLVAVFRADDVKKKLVPFEAIRDAEGYKTDARFKVFCSVRGPRLNAGKLEQICAKAKIEKPRLSIYYQAASTNEPEIASFPYFYVVDTAGAVVHKGGELGPAIDNATKAVDKLPKDDLYFGLMRPSEKCAGVTNFVVEGKAIRPAYQYLKKIMMGRDPEAALEARRLMIAMDQKRDMRIKALVRTAYNEPGKAMFELDRILKMWPEVKSNASIQAMIEQVNKAEDAPKIVKIVVDCEKIAATPIKKKSEAKRLAQQLAMLKKRLEKLANSKNLAVQAEANSYMSRLDEVYETVANFDENNAK